MRRNHVHPETTAKKLPIIDLTPTRHRVTISITGQQGLVPRHQQKLEKGGPIMALPTITITEGTLVADPELRYGQSGTAVVNFRVASNSRRKNDQTGQWEDGDTTFLSVSAFRGLAENIASEFSKGQKISVTGQLKQREYEKDGQKRTVYEVNAQNVSKPVSRFNDSEGSSTPQGGGNSTQGGFGGPQQGNGGFNVNEAAPF